MMRPTRSLLAASRSASISGPSSSSRSTATTFHLASTSSISSPQGSSLRRLSSCSVSSSSSNRASRLLTTCRNQPITATTVQRRNYATPAMATPQPQDELAQTAEATGARPLVECSQADLARLARQRNIGIAAHVDSGKTTLTERVLFYTGRIKSIHEVRGKDAIGAKMDHMELEREKGITIQSAATYCQWKATPPTEKESVSGDAAQVDTSKAESKKEDFHINIIDTPGHVDFTIEVERALRVLDGAVLVLCAASGVQSQSMTVDRQMKRYAVPRLSFINKMDRQGANPWRVIDQIRSKLKLRAAAVQLPMGAEDEFAGVVDLVRWKTVWNEGEKGIDVREEDGVPAQFEEAAKAKRAELIETLCDVDDAMADIFLEEREPTLEELAASIRRATLTCKFSPVFMGTAIKNKGVQALLDGVCAYLPNPAEVPVTAIDMSAKAKAAKAEEEAKALAEAEEAGNEEQAVVAKAKAKEPTVMPLAPASSAPFVGLAFKLEEGRHGQLTYIRVYQGVLKKGTTIFNARTGKKVKVPRLVRMHSNDMEDVDELGAGEICAVFGVECSSGDTFTDGSTSLSMTSMFVPEPVISLSLSPEGDSKGPKGGAGLTPNFSRALNRFQKEDPTFRVHVDEESSETIISGMGELHLEIYVERMKREYNVPCKTGQPRVAFRETPGKKTAFNYLHKKQTGGAGQYARVTGFIEPMEPDEETGKDTAFESRIVGGTIPLAYIQACEKGFYEIIQKGSLTGHPVVGCRMVLEEGVTHVVDSSELAFRIAIQAAFREVFGKSDPMVLTPMMDVSIDVPTEFQGVVVGNINQRKGTIDDVNEDQSDMTSIKAEVALNDMFGYSGQLRGMTAGRGEFSMEYKRHVPLMPNAQREMIEDYKKTLAEKSKK